MPTKSGSQRLVDEYLARLGSALAGLPPNRRAEILENVRRQIGESQRQYDADDEAAVRTMLERLGEPAAIAAEEMLATAPVGVRPVDVWVPWLLLLGGFALVVGWIAGIYFLWTSDVWSVRDKMLGTFILPGGLIPFFVLLTRTAAARDCSSEGGLGRATVRHCVTTGNALPAGVWIIIAAVAVLAPSITAIHLRRKQVQSARL